MHRYVKFIVLITLFTIRILNLNGQQQATYTERYFSNISLPSFLFTKEIGSNNANGNYIKAIYRNKELVKFYAYYHNHIITDTVVYANGIPFYCERYISPFARKGVKVYAIRWHMHDTLFTYWVKFANNYSRFTATDFMYKNNTFIRYFSPGKKFKAIFELVRELGRNMSQYKTDEWTEFTFIAKDQVLHLKYQYKSDSPYGIQDGGEIGKITSPFVGEFDYFGMLMYLYYNFYQIDPFLGSYEERGW
jgi:hypothetical protein